MLKLRIIPLLLIDGPNLVKGSGFDNWRRVGTLIPALNVHNSRDVDELLLVDAGASRNGRPFNLNILRQARGRCFVPLAVGGGLSTIDEASAAIESGADKVVIGSALSSSMSLLKEVADRFGAQAAVAALDVRRTFDGWQMFTHGGSRLVEGSVIERARLAEEAGAGEIVINSIDRDGMMNGFDLEVLTAVVDQVTVPVIASGGAGTVADCVQLFESTGVSAAAAGSLFQFTEVTPAEIREALEVRGHPVRKTLSHP